MWEACCNYCGARMTAERPIDHCAICGMGKGWLWVSEPRRERRPEARPAPPVMPGAPSHGAKIAA